MIFAYEQEIFNEVQVIVTSRIGAVVEFLKESLDQSRPLHEVEEGLQGQLQQLGLQLLGCFVAQAGSGDRGETIPHEGRVLRRSRDLHPKQYRSIFGVLTIMRYVYSIREGQAAEVRPLDEKLGLPASEFSYLLESLSQLLATEATFQEVVRILERVLHVKTTVRAVETATRKVGRYAASYHQHKTPVIPEEDGEILVATVDGKGVPMRRAQEDRLEQELGRKKVHRAAKVPYAKTCKRRGRGGKKSRKQMAYLGAVYSIDRFPRKPADILQERRRTEAGEQRPQPIHKRFRVEMNQIVDKQVSQGQERLFGFINDELAARDPQSAKPVVCLMDGQASLWFKKEQRLPRAVGILDVYHVLEYLWKAAHCFHRESSVEAEHFVEKYLKMMLEGHVPCVIGVFRRFLKELRGSPRKHLESVITYFHHNRKYMHYDRYIAAGYPIGSGVVEGGCRHVVKDRMERSGMRWEVEGAQPLLNLRTIKLNEEWDAFYQHRIQTEQKNYYHTPAA